MEKPLNFSAMTFDDVKKKLDKNPYKCKSSKVELQNKDLKIKKTT